MDYSKFAKYKLRNLLSMVFELVALALVGQDNSKVLPVCIIKPN